jgi:cell division protein FtsI/penicillin-binding protein 2
VFKLITASALIDAGVSLSARTCYNGGGSGIDKVHLQDNPRREHSCASLDEALGKSLNAVFAKLADRHLDAAKLNSYGRAFGFGHALPFDLAPPASPFEVPGDRLEFARTAAGFWHTHMSPLHAALIAATIANDGAMPIPYAVQQVTGPGAASSGELVRRGSRRVVSPATARAVGHMMLRTVSDGTSRSAFLDQRGHSVLPPGLAVAGKTGSLSSNNPYRAYSWWVGYAPADKPRIALAVLVVNGALWRIKSSFVARELLREYLGDGRTQIDLARRELRRR